ncbi:hypothetical protein KGQ31_00130 [Patescibacteria group bacterium]|nr:hypothetical protein [Patescibacteria group bacterium]
MEQISFFLEKFKTLGQKEAVLKGVFLDCVLAVTGVSLPNDSVSFRGDTFFVKTHPALKNELYIKKERILSEFTKQIASTPARNIR